MRRHRSGGSGALAPEDHAVLTELIRRLKAVEARNQMPDAVALQKILAGVARERGISVRYLSEWLECLRQGGDGLSGQRLTHIEYLMREIEDAAERAGQ